MNNKNLETLKGQITGLGFNEALFPDLENNMREGKEEFHLFDQRQFGQTEGEAKLQFRKAADSDNYYFNRYEARMEKENEYLRSQEFNVYKGKGMTFDEAFHQLEGRFVYKEMTNRAGEEYTAWNGLNLDNYVEGKGYERLSYNDNYGFDLQKSVDDLKMQPLSKEINDELLENLKQGKQQTLMLSNGDGDLVSVNISANARYKSLDMHDMEGDVIKGQGKKAFLKSTPKAQTQQQAVSEKPQQKRTEDSPSLLPKKKQSNGLLPKKKVKQGKGLKV